jgi:hypothetical protein
MLPTPAPLVTPSVVPMAKVPWPEAPAATLAAKTPLVLMAEATWVAVEASLTVKVSVLLAVL